jgi:hypothetical protein
MLNQQKKRKVGRPKLPRGEAKGRIVPVRFTKDDLREMESAAQARGKRLSEWVRTALFLDAKERYRSCIIELATRNARDGGVVAFGWITTSTPRAKPISFEAPGPHLTREAAIEAGIAWCKEKIDLPPRHK